MRITIFIAAFNNLTSQYVLPIWIQEIARQHLFIFLAALLRIMALKMNTLQRLSQDQMKLDQIKIKWVAACTNLHSNQLAAAFKLQLNCKMKKSQQSFNSTM